MTSLKLAKMKLHKRKSILNHLLADFCFFFLPTSVEGAERDLETWEVWDLVLFLVGVALGAWPSPLTCDLFSGSKSEESTTTLIRSPSLCFRLSLYLRFTKHLRDIFSFSESMAQTSLFHNSFSSSFLQN